MLVLHGGVLEGELVVWGERAAAEPARGARGGRGASGRRKTGAAVSPFDAGAEGLSGALQEAGLETSGLAAESVVVWLPTQKGRPLASTPLIEPPLSSRAKVVSAAWSVTGLRLSVGQAVTLLCACAGRSVLARGVVVGRDVAFWTSALRFAGELAVRQQFLPGVAKQNGHWRACWEPVLQVDDAERLTLLARAMPGSARAVGGTVDAAPERPARQVLEEFVAAMVDCLVRTGWPPPERPRLRIAGRTRTKSYDSLHDQWLDALRSPDGKLDGSEKELAELAAQVREWRRPLSVTLAAPVRLCFRLEEPFDVGHAAGAPGSQHTPSTPADTGGVGHDDDRIHVAQGTWYVRYLLQAADDPSLLVPAADVWEGKGRLPAQFRRGGFDVREYLLSSLGQSAGLCPRIEQSLKGRAPAGYELDGSGAHEFLVEKAAGLQQAGFGVMLPAWWTGKGTKLRLAARAHAKSPKMTGGGGLSLEDLVRFDWEIALGEQTLSLKELRQLARLKTPLVRVRGQWVEVGPDEIQKALELLGRKSAEKSSARDLLRMALGAASPAGPLEFVGVEASGWMGELLERLTGRAEFAELDPPPTFEGTLRPYQRRGYSWLAFLREWGLGACLADDMGLGKTIQTLALIDRDWHDRSHNGRRSRRPVLLICPTSVVGNWQKEAERFTPGLPVMIHHGADRKKGAAFRKAAKQHALVISSYGLVHRDLKLLQSVPWQGVVLDEAQNIKNPETKQAQAARALEAGCRIALTGTPVENNVGDLWSIMEFLNPGLLGTQAEFKRRFFIPIQAERDPQAAERLKRLTGPFILRRLKTDKSIIADLPDKLEMKVFCTLTKEQVSLYEAVVGEAEDVLKQSEGIRRKGLVLGLLSKLKQVCNHPAHFLGDNSAIPGRSGKLARLTEMLEEVLEVGERALVFTQFTEMGDMLRRHLQETFGREVLFLHGQVPRTRREAMVERFQADDGPPVFLLSLKAGGTGLNLTRANHVFHFDRWWNPAVENQATDRAFRIGQTKNVQVHKFLCVGTLEEKIDEMIERKKEVAEQVVGTGEAWLTELSNEQLRDLFALRETALAE